jgi:hypothetical protein
MGGSRRKSYHFKLFQVDMTDKSLEHALLREIKEEVGLDIK